MELEKERSLSQRVNLTEIKKQFDENGFIKVGSISVYVHKSPVWSAADGVCFTMQSILFFIYIIILC